MADLFETRVPLENNADIFGMGVAAGAVHVLEVLQELPEDLRRIPGTALAVAKLETACAELRVEASSRNLRRIAAAGHDINQFDRVDFDPMTGELVCHHQQEGPA